MFSQATCGTVPGVDGGVLSEELGGLLQHILGEVGGYDAGEAPGLGEAPREEAAAAAHVHQHLPQVTRSGALQTLFYFERERFTAVH